MKDQIPKKLLWIDLEMTGLDPEKDRIIEVAAIVTDFEFNEESTFDKVIAQDDGVLEAANDWVKNHLQENGLFERVKTEGQPEQQVVADLLRFIDENFDEPVVLAGNSIHQDRRFIRKWWPQVEQKLHYRMLDVSSFKVFMQGKHNVMFEKSETHRAMTDIRESIKELQHYIEQLSSGGL